MSKEKELIDNLQYNPNWNLLINNLKKVTNKLSEEDFINLEREDFLNIIDNDSELTDLMRDFVSSLLMSQWFHEVRGETEPWLSGYKR